MGSGQLGIHLYLHLQLEGAAMGSPGSAVISNLQQQAITNSSYKHLETLRLETNYHHGSRKR